MSLPIPLNKQHRLFAGVGVLMLCSLLFALSPTTQHETYTVSLDSETDRPPPSEEEIQLQNEISKLERIKENPSPFEDETVSTAADRTRLPSRLNLEDFQDNQVVCKHWRSGNRSVVDPTALEVQMLPQLHYEVVPWSLLNRTNNPQSLQFCEAAKRVGWERPISKSGWIGGNKSLKEKKWYNAVHDKDIAMMCHGAVLNTNPGRLKDALAHNKISVLERQDESVIEDLSKVEQFRVIRAASDKLGCDYIESGFHSESYDISIQSECQEFFSKAEEQGDAMKKAVWLTKANLHLASGVKLVSYTYIRKHFFPCKSSRLPKLVQRFMTDVQLMDGRKWDARIFALVASYKPLVVYTYDMFHIRASLLPYENPAKYLQKSNIITNPGILNAFLTNSHVQDGKGDLWSEHNLSPQKMLQYAKLAGIPQPEKMLGTIFTRAQAVIEFVFHTIGNWKEVPGRYRIYGFDFMVNTKMQPVLIDINRSPGSDFRFRSKFGRELADQLYEDSLKLVHDIQTGPDTAHPVPRLGHYHLTYHRDAHAKSYWSDDVGEDPSPSDTEDDGEGNGTEN